ncbi:hypothetical protein PoB_002614200 [Plakobranchus ocellatus]|uniref:Uncharacterized protein n=1 Tax=Plakobranchus ocellatus TaxID=259542 RepID=A0AAV3ZYK9_9GAST|nr:hypothetical protein PoB_002614200 [Plakobranchus ocellatus]
MRAAILDIPTGPSSPTATTPTYMLKVLFLLENQKSTWHLSHPLHVKVLFPLLKTNELHHTSQKSKSAVVKQPMHKLQSRNDGERKSRKSASWRTR